MLTPGPDHPITIEPSANRCDGYAEPGRQGKRRRIQGRLTLISTALRERSRSDHHHRYQH